MFILEMRQEEGMTSRNVEKGFARFNNRARGEAGSRRYHASSGTRSGRGEALISKFLQLVKGVGMGSLDGSLEEQ